MKFIGALLLLLALMLALGFWRGWFSVEVDRGKMHQDTQKAIEKVRDASDRILDGNRPDAEDTENSERREPSPP